MIPVQLKNRVSAMVSLRANRTDTTPRDIWRTLFRVQSSSSAGVGVAVIEEVEVRREVRVFVPIRAIVFDDTM